RSSVTIATSEAAGWPRRWAGCSKGIPVTTACFLTRSSAARYSTGSSGPMSPCSVCLRTPRRPDGHPDHPNEDQRDHVMTADEMRPAIPERVLTDRLELRAYTESDAPAIIEAIEESRRELTEWMIWAPRMRTIDDAR